MHTVSTRQAPAQGASQTGPRGVRGALARRPYLASAVLAAAASVLTLTVAEAKDLPLRDPDGVAGSPFFRVTAILLLFTLIDIVPRGIWRARQEGLRVRTATAIVIRERWTPRRAMLVLLGLVSFYLTYISYRNLKSFLPFVTGENTDALLFDLDRAVAFGAEPANLLHDLLGTGIAAHGLSIVYLVYLAFVPASLAAALVWSSDLPRGFWYVTALGVNWLLGAASYYVLPSLGPIYVEPILFADLPVTGVSELQASLLEHRTEVLQNPERSEQMQSIAAFASLHVSVVFTAAAIASLAGLDRRLRRVLWTFFALTVVATIYFGWHYVIDDVAGVVIGAVAVWVGAVATGHDLAPLWRRVRPRLPQRSARLT